MESVVTGNGCDTGESTRIQRPRVSSSLEVPTTNWLPVASVWDPCVSEHVGTSSVPLAMSHFQAGRKKRKKLESTHRFFQELSGRERTLFAAVTEDISVNSTAGIQNIGRKLWKGRSGAKIATTLFMAGQLTLNVCMNFYALLVAYGLTKLDNHGIDIGSDSLKICSDRFKNVKCLETELHWIVVWRVLLTTEAFFLFAMVFYYVVVFMSLLCSRNPCDIAAHHHFAMMAMPRIMCRFSLLVFLHFARAERARDFIFRGEFRCLATVWRTSLHRCIHQLTRLSRRSSRKRDVGLVHPSPSSQCCMVKADSRHVSCPEKEASGARSVDKAAAKRSSRIINTRIWDLTGMVLCGLLILLSMQVLVLKLTLIYFAGIFSFSDWNSKEWLLFLGFLNQLSGLSMSGEVEMLRILLFKFGGEESKWTTENIEACDTYFHYLAYRAVEQLGRIKGTVMMLTLNSCQLQGLFQGHMRLKEQKAVRDKEISMFQRLHDRQQLIEMRDELLSRFQKMLGEHDQRIRTNDGTGTDPATKMETSTKLESLNKLQTQAIGELRLAAKAQEFIWEWEKVLLLETNTLRDPCAFDGPSTCIAPKVPTCSGDVCLAGDDVLA